MDRHQGHQLAGVKARFQLFYTKHQKMDQYQAPKLDGAREISPEEQPGALSWRGLA